MGWLRALFGAPDLEKLKEDRDIAGLTRALGHRNPTVRAQAATKLGELGAVMAIPALATALKDQNYDVRESAVHALGKFGEPDAVEAVIAGLSDADSGLRRKAAMVLGQQGDRHAVAALIGALSDETWPVRAEAAKALGRIGDPLAVEPVIGYLQKTLRAERPAGLFQSDTEQLLAAAPSESTWPECQAAAEALGQLRDRRATQPLVGALKHRNSKVRQAVENAVRAIGGDDAEKLLAVDHYNLPKQDAKPTSSPDDLLAELPAETRQMLAPLSTRLDAMVVTLVASAEEELEASNASRKQVWGDQVVAVPIRRGSGPEIVTALLECVVGDYKTGNVTRVAVEEVSAPSSAEAERVDRARHQLADVSPLVRADYEKRLIKQMRKTGKAGGQPAGGIRKINVTVYFHNTFGRHEILRVGDGRYFLMPCTKR